MSRYADWKAPRIDQANLIWPAVTSLAGIASRHHERLRGVTVPIQNTPLSELRSSTRRFVGTQDDELLIATGHQSELWHAGVWFKNVVIDRVVRSVSSTMNACAMHVSVDTDQPRHLNVRWPMTGGRFEAGITDDPQLRVLPWAGGLSAPTPGHLGALERELAKATTSFGFTPMLADVLTKLRMSAIEGSEFVELTSAIGNAMHALDWSLGLDYTLLTLSPLLESEGWLALVHHLAVHADRFAAIYNAALADYRIEQGISSTTRPMPDLAIETGQRIELPLWLDDLADQSRGRLSVDRVGDRWAISVKARSGMRDEALIEPFVFDPHAEAFDVARRLRRWLLSHRLRIAPRALTLTMFLRLLVTDLFVHGIGGGRYDQVTDRIIERFFGIPAPEFAVATATLYWPGSIGRERTNASMLRHRQHRAFHGLLGDVKRAMVASIAIARRKSIERATLFGELRRSLHAAASEQDLFRLWQDELQSARAREAEDEVQFDRELFYAMQPRDRLLAMIDNVRIG